MLRSFEVDENRHFNGGKLFETEAAREVFFRHYREAERFAAPHPELAPLVTHLTVYERTGGGGPTAGLGCRTRPLVEKVSRPCLAAWGGPAQG